MKTPRYNYRVFRLSDDYSGGTYPTPIDAVCVTFSTLWNTGELAGFHSTYAKAYLDFDYQREKPGHPDGEEIAYISMKKTGEIVGIIHRKLK